MAINKIVLNTENGEQVLVDLTGDTVAEGVLLEGYTAHGADGEPIVGTMRNAEDLSEVLTEQEALIAQLQDTLKGKAAGCGASVEAWTGTLDGGSLLGQMYFVHYLDETFTPHMIEVPFFTQETITIAAGTFVVVENSGYLSGNNIVILDTIGAIIAQPTADDFYIAIN